MASNPSFRLVNTRYVPPGVYIGQLIIPRPTNLTADARLPAFVGVGNRLAEGKNIAIRRSFIFEESLAFTSLSPHVAQLVFNADQDQNAPGIQLRKQDGTIVRTDFWNFTESVSSSDVFDQVTISLESFDPTATYLIDYQSAERTPQDVIPVEELREVVNVGLSEDAPQFRENIDFFIVTDVTDPVADSGNVNTDSVVEVVSADGGNTGSGVITQATSSAFDHNYNRFYVLSCIAASGSSPNRTATFSYTSTPVGGGNGALPPRPLNAVEAAPTIAIVEGTNQFGIEIELGIELDFAFSGGGNFAVADDFAFHGFGPGLVEPDDRYDNTNQFAETTGIVNGDSNSGSGSIAVASTTDFNRDFNTGFSLRVVGIAGSSPTRTVTFAWASFIELGPDGTFTADEAVPNTLTESLAFGVDVDISFGSSNFVVGDDFAFIANAPALRYSGKDNRAYTLTTGSTSNIVSLPVAQTDPLTESLLSVPHVLLIYDSSLLRKFVKLCSLCGRGGVSLCGVVTVLPERKVHYRCAGLGIVNALFSECLYSLTCAGVYQQSFNRLAARYYACQEPCHKLRATRDYVDRNFLCLDAARYDSLKEFVVEYADCLCR